MALPGPFLAGQEITAGEINDATQKTISSIDVNTAGPIVTGVGVTETTITQLTLGPIDQVQGALYKVSPRVIFQQSNHLDEFLLLMRKDTPLTGTIVASWDMWRTPTDNGGALFTGWADIPASINETGVMYYFSIDQFAGSGTAIVYGHWPLSGLVVTPTGVSFTRVGYATEYTVVV